MTSQTLTDFLLARIAEDESSLPADGEGRRPVSHAWYAYELDVVFVEESRWRADCKAKLRLVELHQDETGYCSRCVTGKTIYDDSPSGAQVPMEQFEAWPCSTLQTLAAIYADHPDYDPAWSPVAVG